MRKIIAPIACASLLLATACATQKPGPVVANANPKDPNVICTMETPTGTMVPKQVCRSKQSTQQQQQQQQNQRDMQAFQNSLRMHPNPPR